MTTDHTPPAEADVDTVANRAAQVISSMGAEIRALKRERDRYRNAWQSARERAQAYGEGILRVVKDRESYQEWLRQAEERAAAVLPPPADRATVLREAADAIDAETWKAKADGVLEPGKYRPCRDASAQLRRMADETQPATEALTEVWVVWREDEAPYGYFATEDTAKQATIDCWQEDEPVCPDYSWRRDGPRWELVVGGEHGGVYASRHRVYGTPAAGARQDGARS